MQGRTFRGQSPDGTWHEGFLIRSPGVKNSRPGEGWYINSENEPAYAHLVKPFTIGMSTGVKDMEGTMVFEGDIIKTTGSNERIFSVEFGEYIAYGVSAKMAAERGIKRVPLAVLSQSEISRRMSAI